MQSDSNILQIDNLSKYFGGLAAVSDCSLKIKRGSITGIIGPNGSGKSTLLGLISGGGIFLFSSEVYYRVRGHVGMGGGDIKFIAAVGALLGLKQVFLVIFLSAFIGSIVGLVGLVGKKLNAMSQIPFGPFLAVGTLIVYFSGENIINMYITTIMGGY